MATASTRANDGGTQGSLLRTLLPILIDVVLPLSLYYTLHLGFGVSSFWSLAAGGGVSAVHGLYELLVNRRLETLPVVVTVSSLAGMGLSVVSGSERFMIAKDSFGSGIVGLSVLWSVFTTKPMMTQGLRPFFTRGDAVRLAAWDRIAVRPRFRQVERRTTLVWALSLIAECVARVVLAYVLPVETMVWLSTVLLVSAISFACVAGAAVAGPILHMLDAEAAAAGEHPRPAADVIGG
ncbi:VC0807 family protein [Streptomyces luteireticuli]|uniref:Intracellular septation protein A n=1 Tax=Streptomyces luteireticuli TaxID=173858 RepID=A0ABN0YN12_9ACTN